ncbi:nuclear transport factor 2 family protein [Phenylobacterium sp.]|uniref:nuclear transport factor 2 family protein n=1 Tax=Phenylobacterium sp. TaxID=1871053 RepID=UPI002B9DF63F|nr:nuclear transport factor 2 family protein [Phenylobacterium sp.]HLZ74198.1 nuclear transport factor 2 family protein [Phenylobacterium sp.]
MKTDPSALLEQLEIRTLIENWVLWRDSGEWDRFATLWRPDGRMITTWSQAPAADFIERSKRAWEGGALKVLHGLEGTTIAIEASRAVAQTKMYILQRGEIDGVAVDVTCRGRFWDLLEKVDGRWGLWLRQPVYEHDTLSTVDPGQPLSLDPELLAQFPEGYRRLAYLQTKLGFEVSRTMPGTRGPEIEALKQMSRRWLTGGDFEALN